MGSASNTGVSSAELPAFVIKAINATTPPMRPRVDVIFDPRTHVILGFRVAAGPWPIPRCRGPRSAR